MAKLTLELFRKDFISRHFEDYEKGYVKLSPKGLKSEAYEKILISDEAFIVLGEDKHFLKKRY